MSEDRNLDLVALDWPGKTTEARRLSLPFQVVETVNEPRVDAPSLFSRTWPENYPEGWKNKLIWGDNRYVMGSLQDDLAGDVDLIYIDPPFATGADFTYEIPVGESEVTKEPSIIEEIAYRDTWGKGLQSYLQMLYPRFVLMRDLLSDTGILYVHADWRAGHYVKLLLDEIFGRENFRNELIWYYGGRGAKAISGQFPRNHDSIYLYSKTEQATFNRVYRDERYPVDSLPSHIRVGDDGKAFKTAPRGDYTDESIRQLEEEGRIYRTRTGNIRIKYFLDRDGDEVIEPKLVGSVWDDIPDAMHMPHGERLNFPTQKPESLIQRIVKASSNEGDLVGDFFCGSGTLGAAAEKLGRRWVMTDISKFAIHTSRKRLLDIHKYSKDYSEPARPFQVINMGNYQKHKFIENGHPPVEEYQDFVLELYNAQPMEAGVLIHGRRANDFVHVASVDSVVTIREIEDCVEELRESVGGDSLHVLGWDFALGLGEDLSRLKASTGVDIQCKKIPDSAVELERASDARDRIKFYDLNYFEADLSVKGGRVTVALEDFILANPEFLPDDAREAISDFSDYIDYWAVDFDNHGDTFHNMWQSFRTKEDSCLDLRASHSYDEPGDYRVLVIVIDVFGNDTMEVFEVEVS